MACSAAAAVTRLDSLSITAVGGRLNTVAIGSSSTLGVYASTIAATYPAVLQRLLNAEKPAISFIVFNKGVGGDTLEGVQARIQRDVVNLSPQFVVLQVGTNDATQGIDLQAFTSRLRQVVAILKANAPLLLMNGQAWPGQPYNYEAYQSAIAQVAAEQGVAVFDRYGLMRRWVSSGRYSYSQILAEDRLHPNDFTYDCMGRVVADVIISRLR